MRDTRPIRYREFSNKEKEVMTTENIVGIQTRAMTEAQHMEDVAQRDTNTNQEGVQGTNPTPGKAALDPAMNPTVDLHRTDDIVIEEFFRDRRCNRLR